MRIILFSQQLAAYRSGVGTYTRSLIHGLRKLGHRITAVVPESEVIKIDGVSVRAVRHFRLDPTPGGWLTLGMPFAKVLSREAAEHDIAYFADAREAWCVRCPPVPVTGMINDSYALDWVSMKRYRKMCCDGTSRRCYYGLLRTVERYTYRRMDGLVANGAYVARRIIHEYGIAPKRVRVINIGIPSGSNASPTVLSGSPAILFVGGNFQRKGLPVLLEATADLLSNFPNARLHVVGRDRNQAQLETRARKLGIFEITEFHGAQSNRRVCSMMKGADVFVLPSITEGFGLVYLEAMRAGTPVIATSMGGASEVFVDGEDALFVEPGDVRGLAEAIERIAGDRHTAYKLGKRGQAASKRFTVEKMGRATEEFFINILKRRTVVKSGVSFHARGSVQGSKGKPEYKEWS